jgi:uncharacterized protein involved in exopolysaccharide biosynthesis
MEEIKKISHQNNLEAGIELMELFYILVKKKWIIISITAFTSIIGVVYSLSLPNIYESKAILATAGPSDVISGALGRYSGLAGLAGINLSQSSDQGNSQQAIQKLSSLSFFEKKIMTNIFEIVYDESIYNKDNNAWVRDVSDTKKQKPSAQESFTVFKSNHLQVNQEKETGFITLSIKHQSPFIAKQWAELMVSEVNLFYREKDKLASESAVSYLNQKITNTILSEIKLVMTNLLKEETQKLSLIEANEYYVFDYIDPPAIMEQKSGPKRSLICIISALLGAISAIFLVLIHHYFIKEEG